MFLLVKCLSSVAENNSLFDRDSVNTAGLVEMHCLKTWNFGGGGVLL
jgi:hypothetical protein